MNIITKNEDGKMHQIITYIGKEGFNFECVQRAEGLDDIGAVFSYRSYINMQEAYLPILKEIYKKNKNS